MFSRNRRNESGEPTEWGKLYKVKSIFKRGKNVSTQEQVCNGEMRMNLHEASANGRADIVRELLAHKADVNVLDRLYSWRPLYGACMIGHPEVVRELHMHMDASSKYCETALRIAASYGHAGVVRELLAFGVDVNARSNKGETVLLKASTNGHADIVRELLIHKADICASDKNGWTALHLASSNKHVNVVRELLSHKADVDTLNNDGWTALIVASSEGHVSVVRELLAHNANVNASTNGGRTALHLASSSRRADIVQELLAHGMVPDAKSKDGITPLALCLQLGSLDPWVNKWRMFWAALKTTHALMSSGAVYEGPSRMFRSIGKGQKDFAAIMSICVHHWTAEQQQNKRPLTTVPYKAFEFGSEAVEVYLSGADTSVISSFTAGASDEAIRSVSRWTRNCWSEAVGKEPLEDWGPLNELDTMNDGGV
ncbi:hypothetical protein Poli38472_001883 [Pythium oligandrum]|uniref:Ankyrin repeat protein n=1 Tax=Pythium oligandrum TaxID=41045 RepID=A0A8K1CTM9_PYTOL|nr:hypothetical protein Poli38472_001883 [Pythium oligandrum]|eukprot:TMW69727.1 hypothetical protein Poli38472_001883 [Pythium oligandrum]